MTDDHVEQLTDMYKNSQFKQSLKKHCTTYGLVIESAGLISLMTKKFSDQEIVSEIKKVRKVKDVAH